MASQVEMDDEAILALRTPEEAKYTIYDPETHRLRSNTKSIFKDPFVLGGLLVTVFALGRGLRYLQAADSIRQNHMMRLRIAGQFFTVGAAYIAMQPKEVTDEERKLAENEYIRLYRTQQMEFEQSANSTDSTPVALTSPSDAKEAAEKK